MIKFLPFIFEVYHIEFHEILKMLLQPDFNILVTLGSKNIQKSHILDLQCNIYMLAGSWREGTMANTNMER